MLRESEKSKGTLGSVKLIGKNCTINRSKLHSSLRYAYHDSQINPELLLDICRSIGGDDDINNRLYVPADLKRAEVQGNRKVIKAQFSGYELKWRDEKEDIYELEDEKPSAKPKELTLPTNNTEIAGKKFVRREL